MMVCCLTIDRLTALEIKTWEGKMIRLSSIERCPTRCVWVFYDVLVTRKILTKSSI